MDKLRNFLFLVIAAVLGGIISLGIYRYVDNRNAYPFEKNGLTHPVNYQYHTVDIPSFDFSDVADVVMPTVVHIKTVIQPSKQDQSSNQQFDPFDFFGDPFGMSPQNSGPQMASGSGVILSSDGYIVTNNHVVNGASEIEVILYDKRSFKADVVGTDPNTDMALLKIDAKDLTPIKIGNSDQVRVGQWVLAVGNPFNLTSTITAGIVSAKGRNISLLGGGTAIESFIQTDAAVNPGNSGGALVDSKGDLIGINTAIASQTGQYAGYAFAVPSNIMKKVVDDLKQYGVVQRGFLGVQIQDVNAELAEQKGLDRPEGVYVQSVTDNSAAGDAGIKEGDVIVKVDDKIVNSVPELQEIVGLHRPGDDIKVAVLRKGQEKDFDVTLRNKEGKTGLVTNATKELKKGLGADFQILSDADLAKIKAQSGVRVTNITGGAFKTANIPNGFIITRIDKSAVFSPNDVYRLLKDKTGGVLVEGYMPNGEKKYYVLDMGTEK